MLHQTAGTPANRLSRSSVAFLTGAAILAAATVAYAASPSSDGGATNAALPEEVAPAFRGRGRILFARKSVPEEEQGIALKVPGFGQVEIGCGGDAQAANLRFRNTTSETFDAWLETKFPPGDSESGVFYRRLSPSEVQEAGATRWGQITWQVGVESNRKRGRPSSRWPQKLAAQLAARRSVSFRRRRS